MTNLYQVAIEYKQLESILNDEVIFEDVKGFWNESELVAKLGQDAALIKREVLQRAYIYKNLQHYIEGLKQAEDALKERRKKAELKLGSIENCLCKCLEFANIDELDDENGTEVKRKLSRGRVDVFDEKLVPPEYFKVKLTVSKEDIAKAFKEGKEIPGAQIIKEMTVSIK
jgi:hypothetical protein